MAKYDIVVFGATGYTGKLCCEYLAKHPSSPRWAVAGRDTARLSALRTQFNLPDSVGVIVANTSDPKTCEAMVEQTKSVVNLVGPYVRYNGEVLIKACLAKNTAYFDLSGESNFNETIYNKYHLEAKKNKTIIVPTVGWDCLPHDLTTYLAIQHAKKSAPAGTEIANAVFGLKVMGSISKGTIMSGVDMAEDPSQLLPVKPDMFSPVAGKHTVSFFAAKYHPDLGWGGFDPLAAMNHRVVNRTWGLLEQAKSPLRYGPDFQWDEMVLLPNRVIATIVSCVVYSSLLAMLYIPPVRWFLEAVLPRNFGPTEHVRTTGWIDIKAVATTKPDASGRVHKSICKVYAKGDPGYHNTSRMLVESALAVVLQRDELSDIAKEGGVLTPALAGGDVVAERLSKYAGWDIRTESFEPEKTK